MDQLFVLVIAILALGCNCVPTPSTEEERKQPGDLVLRDWIVIATCRASCFEKVRFSGNLYCNFTIVIFILGSFYTRSNYI